MHMRLPLKKVKAPRVRMQPNKGRILNALLFVIHDAARRNITLSQYTILKTVFLADKSHLNRYGRPVTFDNYFAMKDGPVASFLYDVLKHRVDFRGALGIEGPLWTRTDAPEIGRGVYTYSNATQPASDDVLSESDMEALSDALAAVSALTFGQIRKLTHDDPAYVDAWEDDGPAQAYEMSYAMLFDVPDYDKAQDLAFHSELV